jgi:hypothetical protein
MVEDQESKLFFLGIYPKCPLYKSVQALLINIALVAFGTAGIYYLNPWTALAYLLYSLAFYFLIMPFTMCKYCYFKVNETISDKEKGITIKRLLSVNKWRDSHLEKHVGQKNWVLLMIIVWFSPIVLVIISFFLNFSIFALIFLIGFIALIVGNYFYMVKKKCPTCAIRKECHSSF